MGRQKHAEAFSGDPQRTAQKDDDEEEEIPLPNFISDQSKKKEIWVWSRGVGLPSLWGVMLSPLWRHAGAVHEHDLPHVSLFLEEGRFQPLLFHGAGGVRDAGSIHV